jgi:hypothetical protein
LGGSFLLRFWVEGRSASGCEAGFSGAFLGYETMGGGGGGVFFAVFDFYVVDGFEVSGWLPDAFYAVFVRILRAFGERWGREG